jgi:glutamate dehydrogenase
VSDTETTSAVGGPADDPAEERVRRRISSHRRMETAKVDLLVRSVAHAGKHPDPAVAALVMRFYRDVPPEDLLGRDPVDVIGAVVAHRRLAQNRPQGTATVRVFTPTVEVDGWSSPHTVVEVVTDDMPFLVDSLTAELADEGRAVHLVIHPQVVVRRNVAGELQEIIGLEGAQNRPDPTAALPDGAIVESWMQVEIDRETDPGTLADLQSRLAAVLRDVREAVEDWPRMRRTAETLAEELEQAPPATVAAPELAEAVQFLRWLGDDHFTFLGYREYDLTGEPGAEGLMGRPGTGLGILRSDTGPSEAFAKLPAEARRRAHEPHALVLTKANTRSTVHRSSYLDYIGVKQFDADGMVTGERRFLGLFTSTAYTTPVTTVPVLARKIDDVMAQSGFRRDGHSYKDLLRVLETYPRDELFQIDSSSLYDTSISVLQMQQRRQTRLFLRRDPYERFVSALVFLPRDRYTTAVRLRMQDALRQEFPGSQVDYTARVTESVLARVHFVVRLPPGAPMPYADEAALETRMVEASRAWEDDFTDALVDKCGEEAAARLLKEYGRAFDEGYKEDFSARAAVADVRALENLERIGDVAVNLYLSHTSQGSDRRFKVYRRGDPISLSTVLPVLSRMGIEVTDERPYAIDAGDRAGWVYDFGLRFDASADAVGQESLKERFEQTFHAAWTGEAEADGFNALVVAAGRTRREAMMLRAYARYLRQISSFSQDYLETTLAGNVKITRLLVELFAARFDPDFTGDRTEAQSGLRAQIEKALDAVASLDQDRILRSFQTVVSATTRTNAYQDGLDGRRKPYLSMKLDPTQIPDLPKPLPRFEIWVYSPRVEGVHLRFGRVARGGLRWSDRREDFRTEVLGLVKAQTVKNAVIVPTGAKGGFVAKVAPDPSQDRDAWLAEGIRCYRTFISGLLDLTDNLVEGKLTPPPRVVRHDEDDTYMVVAADKGTAAFSDIANEVAGSYHYWLGDAFASGGSAGYDHKAMGITARGAWESVKRHFRELGVDTQQDDITVVGVGDMSGDVFGNGMLLSHHIRLVAAFDHRHVFLDPAPDVERSYAERARLFELPRSSWADYDTELISEGGGVYRRSAKSVPISPQVRSALGLPAGVTSMTPAELMTAVLQAPVDLLWNGGIGTYIKSSHETQLDVGDKANDAIRVDGDSLRCLVLGEGGNLGATQLGRIEAAMSGVKLNTDAIDNSAGVDTSDHEVNIKFLLDRVLSDGDLTGKQRNALLAEMADDVAAMVLRNNYGQNVALGNARRQAASMVSVHQRLIRYLVDRGELDRDIEFLPTDAEIESRIANTQGMTSPELAVLLAYSKITLADDLLASGVPDESWFDRALRGYFPHALVERYEALMDSHPLRREIITLELVNDLVNRGGITFVFRTMEETGAGPAEVARAYAVVREVFELQDFWRRVEALDSVVPTAAQSALLLESRRLLDRAARWMLQARGGTVDVQAEIDRFAADVRRVTPEVPRLLVGAERDRLEHRAGELVGLGAPHDLAMEAAGLLDVFGLLDCVEVARDTDTDAMEVAELYFVLSERYDVDRLLTLITGLPRGDRWTALARAALRSDLYGALVAMTSRVIEAAPDTADPLARTEVWEARQAEGLARARATLDEITRADTFDLATLSVALRSIRTLVAQGS